MSRHLLALTLITAAGIALIAAAVLQWPWERRCVEWVETCDMGQPVMIAAMPKVGLVFTPAVPAGTRMSCTHWAWERKPS